MNAFLILSIPLAALLFRHLFFNPENSRAQSSAFIKGCIAFIPAYILLSVFHGLFRPDYAGFSLVLYGMGEALFLCLLFGLGYALFYPLGSEGLSSRFQDLFFMAAGFLTLVSLDLAISKPLSRDFHYLFLAPLLRVGLLFLLPYCLSEAIDETGPKIALWALILVPACFLIGLVEFFFTRNLLLPWLLSSLAFSGLTFLLALRRHRG